MGGRGSKEEKSAEVGIIQESFAKYLTLMIERLERQIVAGGMQNLREVSEEEFDVFVAGASNPDDIREYLAKLETEKGDDEEGEEVEEDEEDDEDDDDDIEVVISSDEEDENSEDEDEEMMDFIVDDE
ncbi:hypothetical protein ACEPPN_005870 [Leptodophora sp. 'Broadleaf-Isolate-01']